MSSQKFTVRHIRDTRGGGVKLTEERDIYELTANMGGRRLRARVLAILPADLIQAAVDECGKTLAGGNDLPIGDRIRNMVTAFKTLGVQPALVEKRVGHALDTMTGEELADLRKIHNSIRDGVSKIADWFGDKVADEGLEGDPVPDRPAPKPRSPKGAALVRENPKPVEVVIPAETVQAPANATEPAANPLHAEGEKIIAEANAKVASGEAAKPVQSFADAAKATTAAKPAAPKPAAQARTQLNAGEVITVEAQVEEFAEHPGIKDGKEIKYVKARITSPEYVGEVSDLSRSPLWTLDDGLKLALRGNGKRVFVDKVSPLTEAAPDTATVDDVS